MGDQPLGDALRDTIVREACEYALLVIASRFGILRDRTGEYYTDRILESCRRLEHAVLAYVDQP